MFVPKFLIHTHQLARHCILLLVACLWSPQLQLMQTAQPRNIASQAFDKCLEGVCQMHGVHLSHLVH